MDNCIILAVHYAPTATVEEAVAGVASSLLSCWGGRARKIVGEYPDIFGY